jgi:hypothetical protein
MLGKMILIKNISANNGLITIELPSTKGIYSVRVNSGLGSRTFKVIRE